MIRAWQSGTHWSTEQSSRTVLNNYGPCHFPEKFISLVILNALEGKPLPIYGKGDQYACTGLTVHTDARALVGRNDWINCMVGEADNLGGHNENQNGSEVVKTICQILDEFQLEASL